MSQESLKMRVKENEEKTKQEKKMRDSKRFGWQKIGLPLQSEIRVLLS
jgi:hypothetical protein